MSLWLTEQEPFQELAGAELRREKKKFQKGGSLNYCSLRGEVSARRQEIARFALQYHLSKETAGVDCGPRLCDFETLR